MTLKEFEIQLVLGLISTKDKCNAAYNPNTPVEVLEKLSNDKSYSIRSRVAYNPNIPVEILNRLSNDGDSSVRHGAAKNPNLYKELK